MFEVCVEQTFAAAHYLRNYKGKCERLHGHNYRIQVTVAGPTLDQAGMLMDFGDIKRALREITEKVDHYNLNELPPFDEVNPSAENIAQYIYEEMAQRVPRERDAQVTEVKVWETDIQYATYRPR